MEETIVRAQPQVLQPRAEPGFIEGQVAVRAHEPELEDDAGEIAKRSVGAHQLDAKHLALQVLECQIGIAAQEPDREIEVARQAFRSRECVDHEVATCGLPALGERQSQQPVVLPVGDKLREMRARRVAHRMRPCKNNLATMWFTRTPPLILVFKKGAQSPPFAIASKYIRHAPYLIM
ncbi:hypothetical protein D3C71_1579250 [compost metagenome]